MKISKHSNIPSFEVMKVFKEANRLEAAGQRILHLSVGQPGNMPPAQVLDRGRELLNAEKWGYTDAGGTSALKKRIAEHYRENEGITIDYKRIFVTVGSSSAFSTAALAAFDKGDEVAMVEPCYPAYRNMLLSMDMKPVLMQGDFDNVFQPNAEMMQALPKKPEGLVVASPSNPTGTILSPERMKALAAWCDDKGVRMISDEIYHGIVYQGRADSLLRYSQKHIVINSFSKYYLMPGWRLGWMVVPEDLCDAVERLLENFFLSPPAFAQRMALEALDCRPEFNKIVADYTENRAVLLDALTKAGITHLAPADGAFYLYADISQFGLDSTEFCSRLLHEEGVCIVPGHDFDSHQGGKFVRITFSGAKADIAEAAGKITRWASNLSKREAA